MSDYNNSALTFNLTEKNDEAAPSGGKLKFDAILQSVGEFGLYQKRLLVLLAITGGCVIVQNTSPVFTMKIPGHRCRIPGYPNDTYAVQSTYHENLINTSIPSSEGEYLPCSRYDVTTTDERIVRNGTVTQCDAWVYDRTEFKETLSSQLNLVCEDKIYRSHSNMMNAAGKFGGAMLSSACGDYFGRRRVYSIMMICMLGSSVGLVFVTSLPALMVLRFLNGASTTGSYLSTNVIGMELMGKSQRRFISMSFKSCEILLTLLTALLAYLFRHWSVFQATLTAPCVIVLLGFFFVPESPRWLISKGKTKEAQKIMDKIARVNGAPPPPRLEQVLDNSEFSSSSKPKVNPFGLYRVPRLLLRYTLLYCSWIFIILCMYGLMLNVSNMSGNIFLNLTLIAAVDALSLLLYLVLIERVGRRLLLVGVCLMGGVACLATILPTVLGGSPWILRGLSFGGRLFISAALMTIYVMSPELFPTVLRSFGLGSCSMLARIGSIASPYVADLNTYVTGEWGPALPQVVFGIAGVLTSAMVLVLPETRGRLLPETITDAEQFGKTGSEGLEFKVDVQDFSTNGNPPQHVSSTHRDEQIPSSCQTRL